MQCTSSAMYTLRQCIPAVYILVVVSSMYTYKTTVHYNTVCTLQTVSHNAAAALVVKARVTCKHYLIVDTCGRVMESREQSRSRGTVKLPDNTSAVLQSQ